MVSLFNVGEDLVAQVIEVSPGTAAVDVLAAAKPILPVHDREHHIRTFFVKVRDNLHPRVMVSERVFARPAEPWEIENDGQSLLLGPRGPKNRNVPTCRVVQGVSD
jgi:hypothetical protein